MSKPDPPAAPNPVDTAAASTSTNVGTAITNAFLNNTNQITPTGNLTYNQTGNYTWNDPYTGLNVNIPEFTATQTLSPQEQAIQDQMQGAQFNLAGMANAQSARLPGLLNQNVNLGSAPAAGDPNALASVPGQQTQLDTSGLAGASNIQSNYGSDFDLASVQKALMGQMQPQLDVQKQQLQQQLADQGIKYGSAAYNNAMMPFANQENNAWMQSITNATAQQAQAMQTANAQAQFQNAAQQQAFQQSATQGDFTNSALQAQLNQANTVYGAQNQTRANWLNEQYAAQNQPINQITSLLAGTQVTNPNFVTTPNNQIPTTDVSGLINNRFSQDMSVYQQQSQNYNSLMGGIFGMLGGVAKLGMGMSDRREKEDLDKIATVFAADNDGDRHELPIYAYSFKRDPTSQRHIGPMAQDVEKFKPEAVADIGGRKFLDHGQVMGSILRAA
jgi:Chaperone of endosialidase